MIRKITGLSLLATALLGIFPLACQPGGVGDPCTPEDEYNTTFPGYAETEFNTESKSFQCETRVCMVNHFRGRVSCKYGQNPPMNADFSDAVCHVPGDPTSKIQVQVSPQLVGRQADAAVYCSCRCDGPDSNARYCKCPSGYACLHLRDALSIPGAGDQLAGSYCVREGTDYKTSAAKVPCNPIGGTVQKDGTITGVNCGVADQG
ncbi:MAG TPA: hypothetical protein VGM44_10420 [Polyangiaceae bacterium]|jgi:hypothetical protein